MNFALDAVEKLIKSSTDVGDGFHPVPSRSGTETRPYTSLYEQIINAEVKLDIYKEFTFAMLGKTDNFTASEQFREIPFFVNLLPYCDFFHIGKSKEFLQNFHTITHASAIYDFRNFTRSNVKEHPLRLKSEAGKKAFVYNTLINTNFIDLAEPVFIEGCYLDGKIELEGENILTGVPKDAGDINLLKGICMTVVPIKNPTVAQDSILAGDSWTSIIYGIEDSFKYTAEEDECSFLNSNFSDWMEENGISPTVLWEEDEPHELWNARLFPVTDEPEEAIRLSLALQDSQHSIDNWKVAPRMSLQEILNSIDYDRLLRSYFEIDQKTKLRNITRTLTSDDDLSSEEIISWCHDREDYETLIESVMDLIKRSDNLLFQARLYKLLSNIIRETDRKKEAIGKGIHDVAACLCAANCRHGGTTLRRQKIQIRSDEVVWVCAPARLDFAGGWSDTPPP